MRTFKLAIVGCGNVSTMHFAAYLAHPERCRIVAACDVDAARMEAARHRYNLEQGFLSLEALIAQADWDVAVVCTPTPVRQETVSALAAAGKHLLVEKPLAASYAEAEAMVSSCEQAGVT